MLIKVNAVPPYNKNDNKSNDKSKKKKEKEKTFLLFFFSFFYHCFNHCCHKKLHAIKNTSVINHRSNQTLTIKFLHSLHQQLFGFHILIAFLKADKDFFFYF